MARRCDHSVQSVFGGEAEYDQVFGGRTLSGRTEDDRHTSGVCKFAGFACGMDGRSEKEMIER